jgi:ETFB lysine methyltransferase
MTIDQVPPMASAGFLIDRFAPPVRPMNESAFPKLSEDLASGSLAAGGVEGPAIPGGWTTRDVDLPGGTLSLLTPAQPDLFLDDPDVLRENERHDYMPYWAFLWPAALKMARAISTAPWRPGTEVLELGAGIGLVGLAAQMRGDRVTYSDYDRTALHVCRLNARRNGLPDPSTLLLDWRTVSREAEDRGRKAEGIATTADMDRSPPPHTSASPLLPQRKFPVILGCEVTYDADMHEVILDVLDCILAEGGLCWLGDPGRYQSPVFHRKATQRGYEITIRNEHGDRIDMPSSEGFQIFEMHRNGGSLSGR